MKGLNVEVGTIYHLGRVARTSVLIAHTESLRRGDFERQTFKYQAVFPDRTGCSGNSVSEVMALISRNDGFSFVATDTKRHQTSVLQILIVMPIA